MEEREKDDIITGDRAEYWIEAMGTYGDPIRLAILNPLIVHVANSLLAEPISKGSKNPTGVIQKGLNFAKDSVAAVESIDKFDSNWMNKWYSDYASRNKDLPYLSGLKLWDLGSGEGYLGRWISNCFTGANCVSVEPSPELHSVAEQKASRGQELFRSTIRSFLAKSANHLEKPNLISVLSVLDACKNPEADMQALSAFLINKGWFDVPIVVCVFDPDYWSKDVPDKALISQGISVGGEISHTAFSRSPTNWEEVFADLDYFVIDQRPLHISLLENRTAKFVHDMCNSEVKNGIDYVASPAPRQGPFYFWVLSVKETKEKHEVREGALVEINGRRTIEYDDGAIIEAKGNLLRNLHEVILGEVAYDATSRIDFRFHKQEFFGSLEGNRNFYSSRATSQITSVGTTLTNRVPNNSEEILGSGVGAMKSIFLGLLDNFSAIKFEQLYPNPKEKDLKIGNVGVPAWPSHSPQLKGPIVAARLLTDCTKATIGISQHYPSRAVFEVDPIAYIFRVYGSTGKISGPFGKNLIDALVMMREAGILDSYSVNHTSTSGLRNENLIDDLEIESDEAREELALAECAHAMHLGLITVRYILSQFPILFDTTLSVRDLSRRMSCLLGDSEDQKVLAEEGKEVTLRALNEDMKKQVRHFCSDAANAGFDYSRLHDRFEQFVQKIRVLTRGPSSEKGLSNWERFGLGRLVVVRDVWALFALALNDGEMWRFPTLEAGAWRAQSEVFRRMTFFRELLDYCAIDTGLVVPRTPRS